MKSSSSLASLDFSSLTQIGSGSYSETFRLTSPDSSNFCVKLWKSDAKTGVPADAIREIANLEALKSKFVIGLLEHGVNEQSNKMFAIYELMPMDLARFIGQKSYHPEPKTVRHIAKQLVSALNFIHTEGFVHRDFNPNNILIDPEKGNLIRVADFGLAVRMNRGKAKPRLGLTGTPKYMSYEQTNKTFQYDYKTDIWSLGCVIAELCLGKQLFEIPKEKIAQQFAPLHPQNLPKTQNVTQNQNAIQNPTKNQNQNQNLPPNQTPSHPQTQAKNLPAICQDPNSALNRLQGDFLSMLFPKETQGSIFPSPEFLDFEEKVAGVMGKTGFELLRSMFAPDWKKRPSASEILEHSYFSE